jgi:hypothetical protein
MTPSHQIIEISMRANAWEEIGKELKIKRKFYVSSRDVRIVCPRLYTHMPCHRERAAQQHATSAQDRQCACNVTLRRVRGTIVVVEKQ